ncbi:universal stress protein [Natrononativus amylolyticus]|uniref:universal stress protein n=1 Tax=Natrononativus amylolyticus TaxID=2963434 RepID=UPI0020CE85C9|nr:universal stress protein [Natrononativus amylolyticus]
MSPRILVGLDGSDRSSAALRYAAETFPDATLVCFHAIDPFDRDPETDADAPAPLSNAWLEAERERADELFDRALEGLEATPEVVRDTRVGSPAETIVAYADENDVDGIVVGSYGRGGAMKLQLGSVAELVVRRASVPVTVVR